ncbi:MAG: sugar ABC transporter ATP-binding protein [Planctomycetota bacterium]|nr:sugar ABC transporter ATP-binding protein [Planctomycetota bacterium]
MPDLVLQVRDIVKTFPGVRALDGVHLDVRRGEVHALVGENGAGKSTLMHILGGIQKPDSGTIELEGRLVSFTDAHQAALAGISVVFQELSLAPNLSVAENLLANRQPVGRWNLIDRRRLHQQARDLLAMFDLDLDPDTPVAALSMARRQVIEILKAISHNPKVLILDEPTSSLTGPDTGRLFAVIEGLKARGASFIYISHHLSEIFRVADRVTVLRDGRHVGTCPAAGATEESLVRMMVGREISNMYGRRSHEVGPEYFCVRGASGGRFQDVSFGLRRGEILGLAGLVGAGRTELGRALVGADSLVAGEIALDGRPLHLGSPREAVRAGVGYLTEDRKEQGLFLQMAIRDNCVAPSLGRFASRAGWMNERAIDAFADAARTKFHIVCPGLDQQVRNLSGGNQQKVLLSMWMGIGPKVLIVDEPTRGVDVGARSEIYTLLRDLAATGVGVVLISSDLLEVLGLSDRVLVMRQGRLAGEFAADQATEENVIACAAGVT